jgi:uncharacterized repeat protein (TIGR03803 family)
MKSSRSLLALGAALGCAAFTFSLAVRAQAQTFTVLANFNRINAYPPTGTFVQGTDGKLYTVSANASNGRVENGNVFSMTIAGEITDLFYFCPVSDYPNCTQGEFPSSLILGKDGNFYGTATEGGTHGCGVVFKITPAGKESTVYNFCTAADGFNPNGILQGSNGDFYVATQTAISQVTPTGTGKALHTFCTPKGCPDGYDAVSAPIQGKDGNIYGVAQNGGLENAGVVYQITASGRYSLLHEFCSQPNCSDGTEPNTLVQDAAGTLYGTTSFGGAALDNATLFKITPAKEFSILHTFAFDEIPTSLIIASDGSFYGTTATGGGEGGGIFQVTPDGVYTDLYTSTSVEPSGLFQATNGIFYGTTSSGGSMGYGEAYSFSYDLSPFVQPVPAAGSAGQNVILLGNGLTGTSSVTFNGVAAAFTVKSDTYIQATVPKGAATGVVSVVTPSGKLDSNPQFVVMK